MKRIPIASPRLKLTTLSCVLLTATLSGCLSSGGGGSSDSPPPPPENPLEVSTQQGNYIGIQSAEGMRIFRGIRYGQAERFTAASYPASHANPVQLSESFEIGRASCRERV